MALPVAAAVPLWVFQTVEPVIPAQIGATPVSPRLVFALATVAGLPIVLYAATVGWRLIRGRWKQLAWMLGLTIVGAAAVAAAWIWFDSRTMPAIEHYGRSGWYVVFGLGLYTVGILLPDRLDTREAIPMAQEAPAAGGGHPMTNPRSMIGDPSRSFRARGKAFRIAAWSVAVVLLLELASLAAWWAFSTWRLGRVVLTTEGPPLEVQVLTESGDAPIGEPVALVPSATLALPHGDYRLRVRGMGQLGRTYRMAVNGGETLEHMINLDEGRLLGEGPVPRGGRRSAEKRRPIPYASTVTAVELAPGKSDLVEWTGRSILRRDGVSGQVVWDALQVPDIRRAPRRCRRWADLARPPHPARGACPAGARPERRRHARPRLAVPGGSRLPGRLGQGLEGPLDLPRRARRPRGPVSRGTLRARTDPAEPDHRHPLDRRTSTPTASPTLSPRWCSASHPWKSARRLPGKKPDVHYEPDLSRRIVLAISGRSGTRLWSHAIDPAFATMPTPLEHGRPRSCRAGRIRPWQSSTARPGWAWTRPPAGRDPARSPWASSPCGPSSTRTSTATANPRSSRWVRVRSRDSANALGLLDRDRPPALERRRLTQFMNIRMINRFGKPGRSWLTSMATAGPRSSCPTPAPSDRTHRYVGVRLLDGPTGLPRWTRPMHPESKVDRRHCCTWSKRPTWIATEPGTS